MATPNKNQLIGLDIGTHSIKLVEIDDSKKGRILKNFGIIGLPQNAIVEGSIKEMEIVSSAIKELCKQLKIKKNANVAASISGYSVIVKKITISRRGEAELEYTINEEAEQYIPFDISDVNLDYEVLSAPEVGSPEGDEGEMAGLMDVMLVAAKKDIVDDYVSLLHLSGLNPVVLDVDAFSAQNAFEIASGEVEVSGCYAIVNVGAEELGINAVKNGVSIFTRDSSYGGSQITEAIMSRFDVSYEEADRIKLGGTKVEKEREALEDIFTSVISGWVQEIKRALDFLGTTYPDETIDKMFLTGGSCRIPGFREYLEMETEIPVEELNPFSGLQINEKIFDPKYLSYMAPQAAVVVGLGLRSIGDK